MRFYAFGNEMRTGVWGEFMGGTHQKEMHSLSTNTKYKVGFFHGMVGIFIFGSLKEK